MDAVATLLLSGGQDSFACLLWARPRFASIEAVICSYGQRHAREIEFAERLAARFGIPTFRADFGDLMGSLAPSALTHAGEEIGAAHPSSEKLPASFVPGRNGFFLSAAAAVAFGRRPGPLHLVIGACQMDYSGYPDCRRDFLDAKERELSKGLDRPVTIHSPLMDLSKADVFRIARDAGELETMRTGTLTCYEGRLEENPWGFGCGSCPSCLLRAKGWAEMTAAP